jgi:hypothetical protein
MTPHKAERILAEILEENQDGSGCTLEGTFEGERLAALQLARETLEARANGSLQLRRTH